MRTTSEPDPSTAGDAAPEEGWMEVARCETTKAGFERGLVVLAMGLPYVLRAGDEGGGGDFRLFVPAEAAEAVGAQLELYERESAGWPPAPAPRSEGPGGGWAGSLFVALLWACAVLAGFAAQLRWPEVTGACAMDARAVFGRGEWWRPATALFLHADAAHLLSNLAGGVFAFALVFSGWGRTKGAALLGISAIAANAAVGAVYFPNEYRSLGASTALFAALGLLTGRALRRAAAGVAKAGGRRNRTWRVALAPLGAGATMLMLYGAGEGEARVDVPAHAAGFCAGLLAGFVFAGAKTARVIDK